MKPLKSQDYYEILSLPPNASQEEIRKAFEICKTTFQGDSLATYSLFSAEENEEIFAIISRAYETLRNPHLRQEYDAILAQKSEPAGGPPPIGGEARTAMDGGGADTAMAAAPGQVPAPRPPGAPAGLAQGAPPSQPGENRGASAEVEKYVASVEVFSGEVLKKVRVMRGMSLEDLADETKIRRTYLEYLEEENFAFLPAPVYVKGFVILMANSLGLPSQKVATDYMVHYQAKAAPARNFPN